MAIHAKLLEFQKQKITIIKGASNPHFKSSYATLNEVLDKVKGPLNDLGIVIVQAPGLIDGANGLVTELVEVETGDKVQCFFPYIGATNAQQLGSANTYARRYSLITLLGLEDEDDDGNSATAPKAAPAAAQRPSATPRGPVERNDQPFPSEPPADDFSLETLEY